MTGIVALSGCVAQSDSSSSDEPESDVDTGPYLDPPEYEKDPENVEFPIYGEELPSVELTAALRGEEMDTAGFDSITMMTFIFSYCQQVCPRLTSTLQNVKAESKNDGFADEMSFVEVTFDPERDTSDTLQEHVEAYNVEPEADDWYVLRPESPERAEEVVQETFGVTFVKTHPDNMDMYMFDHTGLILLANEHGIVERAYLNTRPVWQDIYEDVQTLAEKHP